MSWAEGRGGTALQAAHASLSTPPTVRARRLWSSACAPGAEILGAQYVNQFEIVQSQSPLSLWVALPGFLLDTPNPLEIGEKVCRCDLCRAAAWKHRGRCLRPPCPRMHACTCMRTLFCLLSLWVFQYKQWLTWGGAGRGGRPTVSGVPLVLTSRRLRPSHRRKAARLLLLHIFSVCSVCLWAV